MVESFRFITASKSQRVPWLKSLLKSAREHLDPNFGLSQEILS